MLALKSVELNEAACPVDEKELCEVNSQSPKDYIAIAEKLPPLERARLSQFCYSKAHLHKLALHIASTCDLRTLEAAYGRAGKLVYAQSRDAEETLSKLKRTERDYERKPVSLPDIGTKISE